MALIKCPECGREISNKAEMCPNCGCPRSEFEGKRGLETICGKTIDVIALYKKHEAHMGKMPIVKDIAEITGCSLSEAYDIATKYEDCIPKPKLPQNQPTKQYKKQPAETNQPEFDGIYRVSLFGEKTPVYCPRCHSSKCFYFQQEKIIPGKTKTKYSANLNPLRPFTLVNKKEKLVRPDKVVMESNIQCKSCGFIFK